MLTTVKGRRRLTGRQARFISSYLGSPDATKAAIEAGYSPRTAKEIGYSLLHKCSLVCVELAKRAKVALAQRELTTTRIIDENAAIAFLDPRRLFDANGAMLPIQDWPPEIAAAVAAIEIEERHERGTDGEPTVRVITRKVRFWDKGQALERFFKYLRLFTEMPQGDGATANVVNFGALTVDERHQLRRLLSRALPRPVVDG